MSKKIITALVLIVSIVMVVSAVGMAISYNGHSTAKSNSSGGSGSGSPTSQPSVPASSGNPGNHASSVHQAAVNNVNKLLFLPNAHPNYKLENGTVTPLYGFAPAPMGLGFFGLQNESGTLVGHNYYSNSFQATLRINNLSVYNLGNDGPSSLTFQLNTVMANTTLFGVANYSFWTQNVIVYSTRTHVLSFEDNIWNFSSPTAVMTNNAILNSTGQVYPYPGVHIAIGPSYNVSTPFVAHLYLNTSLFNGNDAVYFNYSIPTIGVSGTYDRVTFNSTPVQSSDNHNNRPNLSVGPEPKSQVKISDFLVSGTTPAPNGLLYDSEIMLGGPGGGSTTNVMNIGGTMSLKYIPQSNPEAPPSHHVPSQPNAGNTAGTRYVTVPSAFDFGTDTGETSVGMAVAWNSAHQAILTPGPSLLYGMWNISGQSQMEQFYGQVAPSNAFLFVSPGNVMSNDYNGYVPLTSSGGYNFWLPAGTYSAEALMSYHNPEISVLMPGENFVLSSDPSTGIYTPLYAENNAQLANISVSGDGTISNPYIAFNQEYNYISPLFGQLNDFAFPQFEAVMLLNTNQYIVFSSMPAFPIVYSDTYQLYSLFYTGLPDNFLGYWIYNSSGVVLENSTSITGWYTYNQAGFPEANVVFWNSSGGILNNDFLSMDSSVLLYNSHVSVWGNHFNNSLYLTEPSLRASWNIWGEPVGISIFGNNSYVINNFFSVVAPAQSPDYSIYSGEYASYHNSWNLTSEQSSSATVYLYTVDGVGYFPGSGSVVGGPYYGGNYWYNFNGAIPYNDNGLIANGGDYLPLNVIDIPPADSVQLSGSVPYVMSDPAFQPYLLNVGAANASAPMNVVIYLNMTNLSELQTFDSAVNSPMSPYFHQFLTPQQFMSAHYPNQSTVAAVESYYSSLGLKVWSYTYAPLAIVVSGTVGEMESAFGVIEFNYYFNYPGAYPSEFMTNTANPYIPAQFNGTILHVYGLSYSTSVLLGGVNQQQVKAGLTAATQVSDPYASSNVLTPPNLENYYNVTTLQNAGFTGQGVSIGILGVGEAVSMSSVSKFWNTYGIHNPTVKFVNLTSNGMNPYREGFEADLDVEWSGAMAPNATIYDVMVPFNITGIGDNAINLELYYFLNVIHPNVISGSWAELQFHHDSGFAAIYTQIGMQAVAEGTTIFLGSADSHSPLYLTVMASPYIVSVGGVYTQLNSTGAIVNESGWYQPEYQWYGGPVGSGGGNSLFFSRPLYQSAERIIVPSVYTNRAQPDISMPSTHLITAVHGRFYVAGGTSYATPISAGIFADIAQYLNESGLPGGGYMGWIQPVLYGLGYGSLFGAPGFHQVNYVEPYPGETGSGYLGQGWNDFAGIGTLSAMNLSIDFYGYYEAGEYLSRGL